ncbi:MAG: cellulase family glycosylhydrolase [Planctomycetota bacterium]
MLLALRSRPARAGWVCVLALLCAPGLAQIHAQAPPELTRDGQRFLNPQGEPVALRGVNLGAWLLLEPWMWHIHDERVPDQHTIFTTFHERFGAERAEALLDLYRQNWITPRDMQQVRSFGFNLVRVPFHYSLIEQPGRPFHLREDAFEWLDRAVDLAEDAGIYVVLDLHGAPGGQSVDMPSGRVGENDLWTDPVAQRRTIWVWEQVSKRYGGRANVVAYDLINEPWGDFQTDVRPGLLSLVDRLHDAIRAQGDDTLILAAGTLQGIDFYGDPQARGWTNVGFTEHAYPGLFNQGEPSLFTHAAYVADVFSEWDRLFSGYDVPFLLGEFNPVWDRSGGAHVVRAYYDYASEKNWMVTIWSYKLLHPRGGIEPDGWYLTTNAEPFELPDLFEGTYAQWEQAFASLADLPLAVDEQLREALDPANPAKLAMPGLPAPPAHAPDTDEALPGWAASDIGDASPGGSERTEQGVSLFGGGADIFGRADDFRLVHKPEPDHPYTMTTRIHGFHTAGRYAKAGLMLRQSDAPDAAHVLLHVFQNGRVVLAQRAETGGATEERVVAFASFPIELGMTREDDRLLAAVRWGDQPWREIKIDEPPAHDGALVGFALSANRSEGVSRADLAGPMSLDEQAFRAWPERTESEAAHTDPRDLLADEQADARHTWGSAMDVSSDDRWAQLTPDGQSAGVWQDVQGAEAGRLYRFTVQVEADGLHAKAEPDGWVEVRIESTFEGEPIVLGAERYDIEDLTRVDGPSTLRVVGPALGAELRVLVMSEAGRKNRIQALRIDNPVLVALPEGMR